MNIKRNFSIERDIFSDKVINALTYLLENQQLELDEDFIENDVIATIEFIRTFKELWEIFEKDAIRKNDVSHNVLTEKISYLTNLGQHNQRRYCWLGWSVTVSGILRLFEELEEGDTLLISRMNQEMIEDIFDFIQDSNHAATTVDQFNKGLTKAVKQIIIKLRTQSAPKWQNQHLDEIVEIANQERERGFEVILDPRLSPGWHDCDCIRCIDMWRRYSIQTNLIHLRTFRVCFEEYKLLEGVRAKIAKRCILATNNDDISYFDDNNPCTIYRLRLLNFFITELLTNVCKSLQHDDDVDEESDDSEEEEEYV